MTNNKEKPMSNASFLAMSFLIKLGQLFADTNKSLQKSGVAEGQNVLDFACGPGYYTIPTAKIVGERGKVYALDIHPLAIKSVEKKVKKARLTNVTTILSGRDTGLPDESVDIILLYDAFHLIQDKQALFKELYRIAKPEGILSIGASHHIKIDDVIGTFRNSSLFSLKKQDGRFLNFEKRHTSDIASDAGR